MLAVRRPSSSPPPAYRPRILVIDDERPIIQTLNRMLRRSYTVTEEDDPRRALALLTGAGEPYDLVISDLSMAPLTGKQLYDAFCAAHPDRCARFMLMTGGAFAHDMEAFLAAWPYAVLWKPFSMDDVLSLVSTTLANIGLVTPRT